MWNNRRDGVDRIRFTEGITLDHKKHGCCCWTPKRGRETGAKTDGSVSPHETTKLMEDTFYTTPRPTAEPWRRGVAARTAYVTCPPTPRSGAQFSTELSNSTTSRCSLPNAQYNQKCQRPSHPAAGGPTWGPSRDLVATCAAVYGQRRIPLSASTTSSDIRLSIRSSLAG